MEKVKTVGFSEPIAANDLTDGRCRQLIEFMKVKIISLLYIFQVLYVLCFSRLRYQVSVYRTIGPLVSFSRSFYLRQNSKPGSTGRGDFNITRKKDSSI